MTRTTASFCLLAIWIGLIGAARGPADAVLRYPDGQWKKWVSPSTEKDGPVTFERYRIGGDSGSRYYHVELSYGDEMEGTHVRDDKGTLLYRSGGYPEQFGARKSASGIILYFAAEYEEEEGYTAVRIKDGEARSYYCPLSRETLIGAFGHPTQDRQALLRRYAATYLNGGEVIRFLTSVEFDLKRDDCTQIDPF
ncbi:hypothetical protein G4G27_15205 [Sphingomonas sp. So64.6b]|uniref:hypothetical protein n=1 Tax=Sphingomonas sp. So64.6b TaxID=2997354 RepID=UPI0016036906|nr:hypothetical protein [Sphingomonas sp. So64.6b]QNA85196.1 hypothetical protein G4G27_15205 [Sphingomonas sp. So64.6b]